jgi:subtilisin-like proprotein convertase family protein
VLAADDPFTGGWQPNDPLAVFLAAPVDGTWTFKVTDGAGADTGSIRAVSLHVTGFVQSAAGRQLRAPRGRFGLRFIDAP